MHISGHFEAMHTVISCLLMKNPNTRFTSTVLSPKGSGPLIISDHNFLSIPLNFTMRFKYVAHAILLDLIALISLLSNTLHKIIYTFFLHYFHSVSTFISTCAMFSENGKIPHSADPIKDLPSISRLLPR
jgi:hypothetical protein